jgi:hypothetical protein
VRGLERPDATPEPRQERQVLREPAKQRLTDMDVRLHESRQNDKPAHVE